MLALSEVNSVGPPPRVWGYLERRHIQQETSRSTPTRVGIPHTHSVSVPAHTVHPHACGDTPPP